MGWEEESANRQRLSREIGFIRKDWGGKISFALIYPNLYSAGMSSLGFQTIYSLLNSSPQVVCERVFYPESDHLQVVSVESSRPLMDFSVLAFSLSYELDYVNALEILRKAGIPLLSRDRGERYPLIIAGGPCVISNPEPLSPFFDAFGLGEGEALLPPFMECLQINIHGSRNVLLLNLSQVPGFNVPQVTKEKVMRQWVKDINAFDTTSAVLTGDTELANMFLIEAERGCERGCRFCLAGHAFKPMRYRTMGKIVNSADRGLQLTKKIGLVGAAILDHPQIEKIVVEIVERGAQVSCSSIRGDALTEKLVKALVKGGDRNLTIAPETGSERLRKLIGKDLSNEGLFKAAELVARYGIKQLKLYFMIGLPFEEEQDMEEIISLVLKLKDIMKTGNSDCHLILNVSPFIPKKGTPFFRYPMARPELLNSRVGKLKAALRTQNIEIKPESIHWSQIQALLSRGDASIAAALSQVKRNTIKDWQMALEESQVDVDYWAHQEWRHDSRQ